MWRLGLAAVLLVTFATAGLAQWPKECRRDISKLCAEAKNKADQKILQCLQSNEKALSPSCRKLLQSFGHVHK